MQENIIKYIMKTTGLTQSEIAKQVGIPRQYISKIYNGERNAGSKTINKLKEYFYEQFVDEQNNFVQLMVNNRIFYFDKNIILNRYPKANLKAIKSFEVTSESSEPFLHKNDIVLVDTSITHLIDGAIHLILYQDNYIFRKAILKNEFKLISDKSELTFNEKRMQVIGMVIPNIVI